MSKCDRCGTGKVVVQVMERSAMEQGVVYLMGTDQWYEGCPKCDWLEIDQAKSGGD